VTIPTVIVPRILFLWASNAINLQFGTSYPKRGQMTLEFRIKVQAALIGDLLATQTKIRSSAGTGAIGMLYNVLVYRKGHLKVTQKLLDGKAWKM
tara:strand:+ start:156 stop:440 length:285 start_codon:yes stop_codon:yes gene_type:complete